MKYITFLGVGGKNGYSNLKTYFGGEENSSHFTTTNLVQKHIYNSFKDQIDRVYVFLTKESKEKYFDELSRIIKDQKIEEILIDQNISSEQFISHLIRVLDREDELILDVTHSFRKIPIRLLFALRYIEAMNQVKIRHIFYGEVENSNTEDAYSIVHDLVKDYQMQKVAEYLTQFDRTLIIRREDWEDLTMRDPIIESLLNALATFNEMTELCNLDSACISVSKIVKSAKKIETKNQQAGSENQYTLLIPLAKKIRQKFERVQNRKTEKEKLSEIIQIMLEHERYQIATTFTDELFNRELIRSIITPDAHKYDQKKIKEETGIEMSGSFMKNFSFKLSQFLKYKTELRKERPLHEREMKELENKLPLQTSNFKRVRRICKSNKSEINNFSSHIRNSMNHASGVNSSIENQKGSLKSEITKMLNIISKF